MSRTKNATDAMSYCGGNHIFAVAATVAAAASAVPAATAGTAFATMSDADAGAFGSDLYSCPRFILLSLMTLLFSYCGYVCRIILDSVSPRRLKCLCVR